MVLPLLFSALAPGLLGGAMSPLMAASLGAGVGGLIQSGGDLETGLLTGLGAFAGGSLLPAVMGGGAGAAANAATSAATTGAGATGLPPGAMASSPIPPPNPMLAAPTAPTAGLPALAGSTAPAGGGLLGKGGGFLKDGMAYAQSPQGIGVGIGAAVGPALSGMFGGGEDDGSGDRYRGPGSKEMKPMPRPYIAPGEDYIPGVSAEHNYGGAYVPSAGEIIDFRDGRYSDGGLLRRYQNMMGPVRMAEGGIATLAEVDGEQAQPSGGGAEEVLVEAVRAIKGQSENPQMALGVFLKSFGEDALRDLVQRVKSGDFDMEGEEEEDEEGGGVVSGEGDGMEDLVPGTIDGERDVLLSDGEFVIPADVVSGLGNGSTDAGARELENMMERVRQSRTGTPAQPPRVPQGEVMPV